MNMFKKFFVTKSNQNESYLKKAKDDLDLREFRKKIAEEKILKLQKHLEEKLRGMGCDEDTIKRSVKHAGDQWEKELIGFSEDHETWLNKQLEKNKANTFGANLRGAYINDSKSEEIKNNLKNLGTTNINTEEYFFFDRYRDHNLPEDYDLMLEYIGYEGNFDIKSCIKNIEQKIGFEKTCDLIKKIYYGFFKSIDDSVKFVRDELGVQNNKNEVFIKIKDNLAIAAVRFLKRIEHSDISPLEIEENIENIKSTVEIFKAVFREKDAFFETNTFENFKNIEFKKIKSSELTDDEKNAMRSLYAKNYASNPAFQKVLLESFEKALENSNTTFYLFKLKNEIKGFDRFDDWGDGRKYFGSFNIDESLQGATLGESMIEQSVNVEAKDSIIVADCGAVNKIGARYIENGFVAKSFIENYYGVPAFSILRDDRGVNELVKSKHMSEEDILSLDPHRRDLLVRKAPTQEALIETFKKIGNDYILTRYFQDQKSKQWVVVLESVNQEVV